MADHGIFVGFGTPTRGRENGATKVFTEFGQYLGAQQAQKNIESFEPVFLQAHGGVVMSDPIFYPKARAQCQ